MFQSLSFEAVGKEAFRFRQAQINVINATGNARYQQFPVACTFRAADRVLDTPITKSTLKLPIEDNFSNSTTNIDHDSGCY